jgi:hypothetical protein
VSARGIVIPPYIIVNSKQHIDSWFNNNFVGNKLFLLSKTRYSNKQISLDWLKHFITYNNAYKGVDIP